MKMTLTLSQPEIAEAVRQHVAVRLNLRLDQITAADIIRGREECRAQCEVNTEKPTPDAETPVPDVDTIPSI